MKRITFPVTSLSFLLSFLMMSLVANSSVSSAAEAPALVDLHAHFFMPEASGFPFFGGFNDPLHASQWSSRLKTRVNAETLAKSSVRIAVVALYSHPLFFRSLAGGQRESIRRQIDEARRFVASHRDWVIARSPAEARAALSQGKRVMILSIEGAAGILENDADIHEFIDEAGVRIVTPLHFIDDDIGGAALMPGPVSLVNPFAALRSYLRSHHDENGVLLNDQGLMTHGKWLISSLVQHGAWIDLSHSSDASIRDIAPLLKNAGQPLLLTHTILRKAFHAERGISDSMLREVSDSGGIIGLLPSDDMLKGTVVPPNLCPAECNGKCSGGEAAYATQYAAMSGIIPSSRIFLGSDIDAPITFLKPECEAIEAKMPKGYWSYSQLSELYRFLSDRKLTPESAPENSEVWVNEFLKAWDRVH